MIVIDSRVDVCAFPSLISSSFALFR